MLCVSGSVGGEARSHHVETESVSKKSTLPASNLGTQLNAAKNLGHVKGERDTDCMDGGHGQDLFPCRYGFLKFKRTKRTFPVLANSDNRLGYYTINTFEFLNLPDSGLR